MPCVVTVFNGANEFIKVLIIEFDCTFLLKKNIDTTIPFRNIGLLRVCGGCTILVLLSGLLQIIGLPKWKFHLKNVLAFFFIHTKSDYVSLHKCECVGTRNSSFKEEQVSRNYQ